jgi:hypothetical protein
MCVGLLARCLGQFSVSPNRPVATPAMSPPTDSAAGTSENTPNTKINPENLTTDKENPSSPKSYTPSPRHRRNRYTVSSGDRRQLFPESNIVRPPTSLEDDETEFQSEAVQEHSKQWYDLDACEMGGAEHGIAVRDFAHPPSTNENTVRCMSAYGTLSFTEIS